MVKRWRSPAALALALLLGGVACGKKTNTTPSEPVLDLAGSWSGTFQAPGGGGSMTWQLDQAGSSISGTIVVVDLLGGTSHGIVSGTLRSDTLTFFMSIPRGGFSAPYQQCSQSASGSAENVTRNKISGSYSGVTLCPDGNSGGAGSLTLTR